LTINGHAIEIRLYAEDPSKGFLPSTGALVRLKLPAPSAHVRTDTGVRQGDAVTMFYDPMIAKVIAWGANRGQAAEHLSRALMGAEVAGVRTNLAFLIDLLRHPAFLAGEVDTGFIERHKDTLFPPIEDAPRAVRLLAALEHILRRSLAKTAAHDPWNAQDGWRLGPPQPERIAFGDGLSVEATPADGGYRMRFAGAEDLVRGSLGADGAIAAAISGRRVHGAVVHLGAESLVLWEGRGYPFTLTDPLAASDNKGSGALVLLAPMPGKVIQVFVKAGDRVVRGQPVAVLEAMKMEHTLAAPGDLIVETLPFAPGDQVSEGASVATFAAAQ
jgi:3-methylcrotonyl-CoA carboxylase alpha subunit